MKNIWPLVMVLALATVSFAQPAAPTDRDGWIRLGTKQFDAKDFAGAIKSFTECTKLTLPFACFYGRGLSYEMSGNLEAAILDYKKVVELDRAHGPSYIALAYLYNKQKKWDEVMIFASMGMVYSAPASDLYTQRAWALLNKAMYPEAIKDATTAIKLNGAKKMPGPYSTRGVAYCATGQVDLAEYDEQKVVALGGTSNKCSERVAASINRDSAVNSFGTVYVDLVNNKYEAAVAKITKVIATYPLHEAYYKRAEIYHLHLKNPALALADVLTLLKLNPNHEEAAALKATLIGAPGQK